AIAAMQFFFTGTQVSVSTATHQAFLANANNALSLLKDDLRSATCYDDPNFPLNAPYPTGANANTTTTLRLTSVFTPNPLPFVTGTVPASTAGVPAAANAAFLSREIRFRRVVPIPGVGNAPLGMVFTTSGGAINYSANTIVYRFQPASVLGANSPSSSVPARFLQNVSANCTLYDLVREERDSTNAVVRGPVVVAHHIQDWPGQASCAQAYFYYPYNPTQPQSATNFPELICEFKIMYFINDAGPEKANVAATERFATRTQFLKVKIAN